MTLRTNVLEIVTTYAHDDKSAVIIHRFADDTYIVGKNFSYDETSEEVSWCWGAYDIKTLDQAKRIATSWCCI